MAVAPVDKSHNLWRTPKDDAPLGTVGDWTLNKLKKKYDLQLDPCCSGRDDAMCENYYTPDQDGLQQPWKLNAIFNPPFSSVVYDYPDKPKKSNSGKIVYKSAIYDWCTKAIRESLQHNTVNIGILPWYQSPWFIDCVWEILPKSNIIPLGRIHYLDQNNKPLGPARFDSFLAVWDRRRN